MIKVLWKSRTIFLGVAAMLGGALQILAGHTMEGITALTAGIGIIQGRVTVEKKVNELNSRIGN